MAVPRTFPQANVKLTAPSNMPDCDPLMVYRDPTDGACSSLWQLSAGELESIVKNGGRIWVRVFAWPHPPISVGVYDAFPEETNGPERSEQPKP